MKKILAPENIKSEIIEKFRSGISIRKLEAQYPYSFTYIQKLIQSYKSTEQILLNYPQKEGYHIIAICKQTKKEYLDYRNESGALTEHVFKLYPEESKKSKYIRKSIEYTTGKFWYNKYFDFEYRANREYKKCHYCDWTTTDVNNSSGAYEKHLKSMHNITIELHVANEIKDISYFKNISQENGIKCAICGKNLKILNHSHLKSHNISVAEYKLNYGDLIVPPQSHEKLVKAGKHASNFVIKSKTSKHENEIGLSELQKKNIMQTSLQN